jgi:hypothetical protein
MTSGTPDQGAVGQGFDGAFLENQLRTEDTKKHPGRNYELNTYEESSRPEALL